MKNKLQQLALELCMHRSRANLHNIKKIYLDNPQQALDFAREHELASILATRLESIGITSPILEREKTQLKNNIQTRLQEVDNIASLLHNENIPLIGLKNVGIAKALYPHPEESPMGDVDLLVKKSDFVKACKILEHNGYEMNFRVKNTIEKKGIKNALLSGGAEYSKTINGFTHWVELQFRPVAGRWIPPEIEPTADELFEKSIPVPNTYMRILSPEDNLLQVCLHTAKHSYIRAPGLRLHCDVDRIVHHYNTGPEIIDWKTFTNKVIELNLKTATYFSLYFAKKLLNTPIPSNVLEQLKPPKLQHELILHLLKNAGFFHPKRKKFSKPTYILFTALLFDNPKIAFKSAFPSTEYMKKHYNITARELPKTYISRFLYLLLKRSNT